MNENMVTIKTAIVAALTALGAFLGWKGVMLLAWIMVMALDYVSGTIAACKEGSWASSVAREGLAHKGGMIFVVLVAAIADWVMVIVTEYIPIGLEWPGIIMPLVLAWYIVTELGSILENAIKLGANVPHWLVKLLKSSADIMEHAGDAVMGIESENEQADVTVHSFLHESLE